MAESPERHKEHSRSEASHRGASRASKPTGTSPPSGETSRAADSIPMVTGTFAALPVRFGRYRIDRLLGKGTMGAVYLAHDEQLDRLVALKVARVSADGSAKLLKRMETEAKAAANLDHPNICGVYDFGEIDGVRFIAMQYIQGENLKSYMNRVGPRCEPSEVIRLGLRLASALSVAHEKGIIHRDLKPENVMLNSQCEPVIMDFGLARRTTGSMNASVTQGMVIGTAAYMSPEQAAGKADGIDHRSDLYAIGVMLFEMLTGEWPFTGSTIEVIGKKCSLEAPSVLTFDPQTPPQLAEVCHKLIARQKEDRYADCAELIAALETINVTRPTVEKTAAQAAIEQASVARHERPTKKPIAVPLAAVHSTKIMPTLKKNVVDKVSSSKSVTSFASWTRLSSAQRWAILGGTGICFILLTGISILCQNHEPAGSPKSNRVADIGEREIDERFLADHSDNRTTVETKAASSNPLDTSILQENSQPSAAAADIAVSESLSVIEVEEPSATESDVISTIAGSQTSNGSAASIESNPTTLVSHSTMTNGVAKPSTEDAVTARLTAARQGYRQVAEKAESELLAEFDEQLKSLGKSNRFKADQQAKLTELLTAEKNAFRRDRVLLPVSLCMKSGVIHYLAITNQAAQEFIKALDRIADLCRERKDVSQVNAIGGEMDDFKLRTRLFVFNGAWQCTHHQNRWTGTRTVVGHKAFDYDKKELSWTRNKGMLIVKWPGGGVETLNIDFNNPNVLKGKAFGGTVDITWVRKK